MFDFIEGFVTNDVRNVYDVSDVADASVDSTAPPRSGERLREADRPQRTRYAAGVFQTGNQLPRRQLTVCLDDHRPVDSTSVGNAFHRCGKCVAAMVALLERLVVLRIAQAARNDGEPMGWWSRYALLDPHIWSNGAACCQDGVSSRCVG